MALGVKRNEIIKVTSGSNNADVEIRMSLFILGDEIYIGDPGNIGIISRNEHKEGAAKIGPNYSTNPETLKILQPGEGVSASEIEKAAKELLRIVLIEEDPEAKLKLVPVENKTGVFKIEQNQGLDVNMLFHDLLEAAMEIKRKPEFHSEPEENVVPLIVEEAAEGPVKISFKPSDFIDFSKNALGNLLIDLRSWDGMDVWDEDKDMVKDEYRAKIDDIKKALDIFEGALKQEFIERFGEKDDLVADTQQNIRSMVINAANLVEDLNLNYIEGREFLKKVTKHFSSEPGLEL